MTEKIPRGGGDRGGGQPGIGVDCPRPAPASGDVPMPIRLLLVAACLGCGAGVSAEDDLGAWRAARETRLRAENGWLALVGRFALPPGANTIGTAADSDILFPEAVRGAGPERLGAGVVDPLEIGRAHV